MKDNNLVQMSEIKREEINKRCIIFKKLIEKSAELVHLNLCVHEGKIGFVDQERWRIVAVWEPMYHRPSDDENDAEEYEKVLEQWKDSVALAEQVKRVGVQKLSEILAAEADGRCVVLPCKVGDTVYQVETSKCKNMDLYKCEDYCYGFGNCWEGESFVKEVKFELWMIACIDKTVFLNREAAEKAMKEMEGQ